MASIRMDAYHVIFTMDPSFSMLLRLVPTPDNIFEIDLRFRVAYPSIHGFFLD